MPPEAPSHDLDPLENEDLNFDEEKDPDAPPEKGAAPRLDHPRKISEGTIRQYFKFVKVLQNKFLDTHHEARTRVVEPIDLVDFLISISPTLRPKTFINYRCGLLYWLSTLPASPDSQ